MRKIRGFRLRLPVKETRRRTRKAVDLAALGLAEEPRFSRYLDEFSASLQPAVIFDSFGPESMDTEAFAPIPGLAHTLGLATLGPETSQKAAEERGRGEAHGKLYDLCAGLALEASVQFVIGLITDEVEAERCDLSPIQYLTDAEALGLALEKLEGSKIGIKLEANRLVPEYSAAFCLSWISRRRSKSGRTKT
ncbi:MAG: hypothetical protein WC728_09635 [Elusimicrobiota bacterium]